MTDKNKYLYKYVILCFVIDKQTVRMTINRPVHIVTDTIVVLKVVKQHEDNIYKLT